MNFQTRSKEPERCFLKNPNIEERRRHTENISRAKSKKHSCRPLARELKSYRSQGVDLYLDGEPSSPKSIAKACQLAEGGNYMRDYIEDEKGRIARVDFDFVEYKVQK